MEAKKETPCLMFAKICGLQSPHVIPVMLPHNVALAPSEILEMIRCGCFSDKPCYTTQCQCTAGSGKTSLSVYTLPKKGMLFVLTIPTHSVLFLPQVAHKTSTRERHCCRFAACLVMVSQVSPHAFISFSMVLRQVSLGRPLLRFPSGVQRMAILGSASCGIRHTCPAISIFSSS